MPLRRQYRVPLVTGTLVATTCVLMTLAGREIALAHVTAGMSDTHQIGSTLQHLRYQYRALAILASIAGFAAGWIVGNLVMEPFHRLRSELVSGSISSVPLQETARWSADANALKNAALRHESDLLRQTNEHIRESSDLKQLLNAVSEGLVQIDSASRVMQANPAALRLLGLPHDAGGRALVSIIRHVELRDIISRAAAGESLDAAEVMLDERQLLISAAPIPVASEHIARSSVIAIADLTQLRRLEGVRRDFVANVSHELKTPLTSIHGYAETLLADDNVPAATRRPFLEVIHRNAVRLQRIVDDLLDLSKIESGAWQPELQDVELSEVVDEVWSGCGDMAAARAVSFVHTGGEVRVRADPHGLRQVFSNLFTNALRHTPAGGSIEVAAFSPRENTVRIAVKDTGVGIPREAIGRIFERFYRVDTARSRSDGGTGLGLAIVKHIIETMGGSVTAESELGHGTTIILTLPSA